MNAVYTSLMPRSLSVLLTLGLVWVLSSQVLSQAPQLRVVDAAPRAEVNQLSEANEILSLIHISEPTRPY